MPGSPVTRGFKDETEFNKWLRTRIRRRGYGCVHVREADTPGPLDLVVWWGTTMVAWIELKLDDRLVEASQIEFMRGLKKGGTTHCVVRFRHDVERFEVSQMNSDYELKEIFSTDNVETLLDSLL